LLHVSSKYKVEIAGIDISSNMLKIARDKLGEKPDLRVGDSEKLPFEDKSFDIVTCTDSFHHYPHPENVLTEIKRVLKPKGILIIVDVWAPIPFRQLGNLMIHIKKGGAVRFYSEAEIHKLLENAGFKTIKWEQVGKTAFITTASN
jgi:ubiquinone/menaquinone biosynthesis C-methylase UbiE